MPRWLALQIRIVARSGCWFRNFAKRRRSRGCLWSNTVDGFGLGCRDRVLHLIRIVVRREDNVVFLQIALFI